MDFSLSAPAARPMKCLFRASKITDFLWETYMSGAFGFEKLCSEVAGLSRNEVKTRLLHFHGRLKMDFTEAYLDSLALDKLRHILLAALAVDARKRA
jgi:hypothetical protein